MEYRAVRFSGESSTEHCIGVASCCLIAGLPPASVAAMMLHAAYIQVSY